MKKYLLISHKYGKIKRGAYTSSEKLSEYYPDFLESKEDIDCKNLENLNKKYRKLIFVTQVPRKYVMSIDFIRLMTLNHIMFIRNEHNTSLYNSASNGFYYYLESPKIKNYIPFIYSFSLKDKKEINDICIGIYYRPNFVEDASVLLKQFLDSLPYAIDLYIMGFDDPNLINHKNVLTYNYTSDNQVFFSNITHYLHLKTNIFKDPFPNTLMEAVQINKQIIIFGFNDRHFRDGVDDIESTIYYHDSFKPDIYLDNSDHIFKIDYYRNFYNNLFINDFEYNFDRMSYNNFMSWFEGEIIR